jgi:hypothetical protein
MRDPVELATIAIPILVEAVAVTLFLAACLVILAVWSGA